jgi:glutamate N-acetyltransferase/amino-acid N-acetyltransferase
MVMDTLALAVSATANYVLRHQESRRMLLPLVAFPLCGFADLFCIYHELKAVQLRSLNRERAEMVAEFWLSQGRVSSVGGGGYFGACCVVAG